MARTALAWVLVLPLVAGCTARRACRPCAPPCSEGPARPVMVAAVAPQPPATPPASKPDPDTDGAMSLAVFTRTNWLTTASQQLWTDLYLAELAHDDARRKVALEQYRAHVKAAHDAFELMTTTIREWGAERERGALLTAAQEVLYKDVLDANAELFECLKRTAEEKDPVAAKRAEDACRERFEKRLRDAKARNEKAEDAKRGPAK